MVTTLTAQDIAQHIRRPGEPLTAAVDRLRNWTKVGLIKPTGDLHPGTGRKKRYDGIAATRAMLFQMMSDAIGSPAVVLAPIVHLVLPLLERAYVENEILVISRAFDGNDDHFEVNKWKFKDLRRAISRAAVHIVINPRRIFDRLPRGVLLKYGD